MEAREYGQHTGSLNGREINTSMPNYVVNRVGEALNAKRKAINGSRVCSSVWLISRMSMTPRIAHVRLMDLLKKKAPRSPLRSPHLGRRPHARTCRLDRPEVVTGTRRPFRGSMRWSSRPRMTPSITRSWPIGRNASSIPANASPMFKPNPTPLEGLVSDKQEILTASNEEAGPKAVLKAV